MAKFVKGSELNHEIEKLFRDAKTELFLVSPYIKLHPKLKDELKSIPKKDKLFIDIVFGKNEADKSKSISIDDIKFLLDFPNLTISYEERLHAKFYSNEHTCILSSMNLYDYSFDKNIEFGVVIKNSRLDFETLDDDAVKYFEQVRKNAQLIYQQAASFTKSLGGLKKTYEGEINILEDKLFEHFPKSFKKPKPPQKSKAVVNEKGNGFEPGFCIRTGDKIPFNIDRPLSYDAFKSWAYYENEEFEEKYCHFSGEASNGETCFARPILRKNWKKARDLGLV